METTQGVGGKILSTQPAFLMSLLLVGTIAWANPV